MATGMRLKLWSPHRESYARAGVLGFAMVVLALELMSPASGAQVTEPPEIMAHKLFQAGQKIADKTHYLEALDLFDEARDLLETAGKNQTRLYADLLFASAQAKVKGRLYQNFAAAYVKSALKDIQASNHLRERLSEVIPQELADGYYLEGFIHKRFFMRQNEALQLFRKAIKVYPGHIAAKRELSELVQGEESK